MQVWSRKIQNTSLQHRVRKISPPLLYGADLFNDLDFNGRDVPSVKPPEMSGYICGFIFRYTVYLFVETIPQPSHGPANILSCDWVDHIPSVAFDEISPRLHFAGDKKNLALKTDPLWVLF